MAAPGAWQRFHCGLTCQSDQKPHCVNGSSLKLDPIERSGTTMSA